MQKIPESESIALRMVATRLQTHGWTQNDWGRDDGPNCISGAFGILFESSLESKLWHLLSNLMQSRHGIDHLVTWNDSEGQTAENVINTLLDLAEELRLGGY